MIELLGLLATVIAIAGVLRNNRMRRDCFLFWMVSNAVTAGIHAYVGIWSLFGRDVVFFILAVEGLRLWRRGPVSSVSQKERCL